MATKALIIKVNKANEMSGESGKWINNLSTQMPRITGNIDTPNIQDDSGQTAAIVSGIPTPFARPVLFEKALGSASNADKQSVSDGLQRYYDALVDEWRGLIACLALDTDTSRIHVETVTLAYSDGKDFRTTQNVYEPKGAFGNMLLDERNLWCDQTAADFNLVSPQISIIKYRGKVIGGTSPKVLVFTASNYSIDDDVPYVNPKSKHFTDPLRLDRLTKDQYLALWAYVNRLVDNFRQLTAYFKKELAPNYTAVQNEMQRWLTDIAAKIAEKGIDMANASPLPVSYFKQEPFARFFNFSDDLYALNGIVYSQPEEHAIPFTPDSLLLPNDTELVHVLVNSRLAANLSQFPLTLLRASKTEGSGEAYFALPLSEKGIKVFEKNIDSLLRTNDAMTQIGSTLSAIFDERKNELRVELTIVTKDGVRKPIIVNYRVNHNVLMNKDVLIWPNFAAAQWNRYFLYSEMPHNDHSNECPFEAVPFCGDCNTPQFDIIMKQAQGDDEKHIALAANNGKPQTEAMQVQLDVVSDYRTNDQRYKYEIYESNMPFRGLQLSRPGKGVCGYFLIRYTTDRDDRHLPHNYGAAPMQLAPVNLGVDFGSTNTSVAYYSNADGQQGFKFSNHRISLLQGLHNMPKVPTLENTVFFFQREQLQSNTIKSMLTLHDQLRLPSDRMYRDREAVTGGFPCFSRDLPLSIVNGDHIALQFRNTGTKAEIVNDMKWKGDEADKNHKQAFLSTLMLHVYAELFALHKVPSTLKWSYPSSMGYTLLQQYNQLWNALKDVSPVNNAPLRIYPCPGIEVKVGENPIFDNAAPAQPGNNVFDDMFPMDSPNPFDALATGPTSAVFGEPVGQEASGGVAQGCEQTAQTIRSWDDNAPQAASPQFGFGTGMQPDGFGPMQQAQARPQVKDLVPDNGPLEFNIKPVPQDTSLTEACAVANNIASVVNGQVLTLCFDIGGSTTDISAICFLKDAHGMPHPTLIKQNSIRFAAQRVSKATAVLHAKFKNVLLSTCNSNKLRLTGLNAGEDKYNESTAAYFYEQIVDILTPAQQVEFYRNIAANCPELFCVNLYVTGLIMYYAGQITEKLVKEVRRSKDGLGEQWRPAVQVKFAGKGSRIFDWFSCLDLDSSQRYCTEQFLHGMGGMQAAKMLLMGWPMFDLHSTVNPNVKYEVAFGLASPSTDLHVPQDNAGIEILGEEGFSITTASTGKTTPLPFDNSITTEMMQQLGIYFQAPAPAAITCKRFIDFAGVFYTYALKMFGLTMSKAEFMDGFRNMNINAYIQKQPEYREAKARSQGGNGKFDYVNPIIILEGMKFYEDNLLRHFAKQVN